MHTSLSRSVRLLALICALAFVGMPAGAQSDAPASQAAPSSASTPPAPTREAVQAKLSALTEDDTAAAEAYREALAMLDRKALAAQRAEASRANAEQAAPLLEEILAELKRPAEITRPTPAQDATLTDLEQSLAQATADLERARAEVNDLQALAARREARQQQIPGLISSARQRLSEIPQPAGAPANTDEPRPVLVDARETRALAEIAALAAEIDSYEAELAEYTARRTVLPARRDRAARRVTQAEARFNAWQSIVRERREAEAEARARRAEQERRDAARRHPVLKAFAEDTERLANARTGETGVPRRTSKANDDATAADRALAEIRDQYNKVFKRIEATGLNRATGLLLRRHYTELREGLTEEALLRRRIAETQSALEAAAIVSLDSEEAAESAGNVDAVVAGLMREIRASGTSAEEGVALEVVARELALSRRELLTAIRTDADAYEAALTELDESLRELLEAVVAYEAFIRERTLWVRSIAVEEGDPLDDAAQTIQEIGDGAAWHDVSRAFGRSASSRWPVMVIIAAVIVLAFAAARYAKRRLQEIAKSVGRFRTDRFGYTFEAVWLTGLRALPAGSVLVGLGWLLSTTPEEPRLGVALGAGLMSAGFVTIGLRLVRAAFQVDSLAVAHFRWPEPAARCARRLAGWFVPLAAVSVGLLVFADGVGTDVVERTLGRLAFSVLMAATVVVCYLVIRRNGPLGEYLAQNGGWADRLRFVWVGVVLLVPIGLLLLPWLGFFYTARQLGERLEVSLVLLGLLVLANALLMRWLFIARRRVAVEDARRRREQAIADSKTAGGAASGEGASTEAAPAIDEDKIDLPAISQQTQQLFRTGLVVVAFIGFTAIWAEVLPALRMLDRVQVYPSVGLVEAEESDRVPILETAASALRDGPGAVSGDAEALSTDGASPGNDAASRPANGSGSGGGIPGLLPGTGSAAGGLSGEPTPEGGGGEPDALVLTLADIGLAIVLLVATVIAFRNIPGLAEIAVLQRLPLDAGSRYAVSTVLRYIIAMIGIVAVFGAVNIGWSNVQWLAAAFTFGLAFGLQEIFANFVSGLIILAERPIRIGDVVTVGNVSGPITRIRMRATTITDWDRKEMVIPNKNFITGDIINWTLSDPLLRVNIPVGISYGADVRKVERVLVKVARQAPIVLDDPAPYAYFNGFGDSTLNFELRVYIPHVEHFVRCGTTCTCGSPRRAGKRTSRSRSRSGICTSARSRGWSGLRVARPNPRSESEIGAKGLVAANRRRIVAFRGSTDSDPRIRLWYSGVYTFGRRESARDAASRSGFVSNRGFEVLESFE
jgi:potassium efflux system protein